MFIPDSRVDDDNFDGAKITQNRLNSITDDSEMTF